MLVINEKAKPKCCIPDHILNKYIHVKSLVGSKAICSPPPDDTDEDWLVYFVGEEKRQEAIELLKDEGWKYDDNYPIDKEFVSLKQEGNECNLIMTSNENFYADFTVAVEICKKFNVMDKDLRIWVHNKIMGKEEW